MADENLTFLTEIEIPEYCFVSEAVSWMALGRVPQAQMDYDSKLDEPYEFRFYWREMPDNFEPHYDLPWFDRLEFGSLGIAVDQEYFIAAEKGNVPFNVEKATASDAG